MTPTTEVPPKSSKDFKTADRAHTSFLAAAEKRTLIWIATRLPAWVNSDHLTALGFISLILAGASYWYARFHAWALLLVIPFLALNWFGDSLDGTLARVRNRQRPRYGFYVDHILDAVGMSFLMAGLALSGYMSPLVAGVFLIFYLLLSIEIYLATYTIGTFHLSYWRFWSHRAADSAGDRQPVRAVASLRHPRGPGISAVRRGIRGRSRRIGRDPGAGDREAYRDAVSRGDASLDRWPVG